MPTPAERKALAFIACVGLLGAGARVLAARSADHEDRNNPALIAQLRSADSAAEARAAGKAGSRARASAPKEPEAPLVIDVDVAAAIELDRLPRIGPVLAARIVTDRETNGPFGSLAELERVSGVGPKLAETIRPYVTFSGRPRPKDVGPSVRPSASGRRESGPPRSGTVRP
ncbi:MAG TPA: helix-hairpin-helix domain-containing protein [Gemmatimonadales bacterium]|nr:helix-hairpin-helix domain-containing protein [Gemmatimonadales bacterium]